MHQEMGDLVKHYEQAFVSGEPAVDRDKMPALHAVVKSVSLQRHLGHMYTKPAAETVKISLGERPFVPGKSEAADLFD